MTWKNNDNHNNNLINIENYRNISNTQIETIKQINETNKERLGNRFDYLAEILNEIYFEIEDILLSEGIDIFDDKISNDYEKIKKMIKAMVMRHCNLKHEYQFILDDISLH